MKDEQELHAGVLHSCFVVKKVHDSVGENLRDGDEGIDFHVFVRLVCAVAPWAKRNGRDVALGNVDIGVCDASAKVEMRWRTNDVLVGSGEAIK